MIETAYDRLKKKSSKVNIQNFVYQLSKNSCCVEFFKSKRFLPLPFKHFVFKTFPVDINIQIRTADSPRAE